MEGPASSGPRIQKRSSTKNSVILVLPVGNEQDRITAGDPEGRGFAGANRVNPSKDQFRLPFPRLFKALGDNKKNYAWVYTLLEKNGRKTDFRINLLGGPGAVRAAHNRKTLAQKIASQA